MLAGSRGGGVAVERRRGPAAHHRRRAKVVAEVGEGHVAGRRHRRLRRLDLHLDLGGDVGLGRQLLAVDVQ